MTPTGYRPVAQSPTYPYAYVPRNEIGPYLILASRLPSPIGCSHRTAVRVFRRINTSLPDNRVGRARFRRSRRGVAMRLTPRSFPNATTTAANRAASIRASIMRRSAIVSMRHTCGRDVCKPVRCNRPYPQRSRLGKRRDAGGPLAEVTWVTPSFADSDHALGNDSRGPSWVASIVNAVGASPYWNLTRTASIFASRSSSSRRGCGVDTFPTCVTNSAASCTSPNRRSASRASARPMRAPAIYSIASISRNNRKHSSRSRRVSAHATSSTSDRRASLPIPFGARGER